MVILIVMLIFVYLIVLVSCYVINFLDKILFMVGMMFDVMYVFVVVLDMMIG